ncbi:MAG TPA: class II aldolase/adducin family protein [Pilimelia sp.]|nr:class II aldolase/adducin family protein [Pilimelia sp.]
MSYVSGDLRDQLAHVGFDVVRSGLVVGSGGNLSAREPGGDECWVTAAGTWLDRLDRPSFVRVRIADGSSSRRAGVAGSPEAPVPSTELALHLATYRARPDVNAVVHLHPQTVVLLDALGERIRLVTTDHAYYLRQVVSTPFRLPGSEELATEAASAAATGVNCIVLGHHGCSVLGETVEWAHKRARNLEEAARLTYQALVVGALDRLPECPAEFVTRLASLPPP